jgi:tRNA threonylcarbamoyladenosine biosynthesis protein TsaE
LHSTDDSGITLTLADENATLDCARRLAVVIVPGTVIYLHGDLGAGKTTLVRGLLYALGYTGRVKSPTYTLLEPYQVENWQLRHFDLYRMHSPLEWEQAGFNDEVDGNNVFLIEWPEQAASQLPSADIEIDLVILNEGRTATLRALSPKGVGCLKRF